MSGIIALVVFSLVMLAMTVGAELARSLVARLARLALARNRLKVAVLARSPGPRAARLGAILVGPLGGYVMLCAVALLVFRAEGVPGPFSVVGEVYEGYPAASQLVAGDEIVDVNGAPFTGGPQQLREVYETTAGASVAFRIVRNGEPDIVRVAPMRKLENGHEVWLLGVTLMPKRAYDLGAAASHASDWPIVQARSIWRGWVDIFLGRDDVDPGGPVRISYELNRSANAFSAMRLALIFGVYFWLALCVFDLVRAIIVLVRR
jgi:hypothetical protein